MESTNEPNGGSDSSRCSSARPFVIYGTDIEKQPDILIEEIRDGLAHLRGQLRDVRSAYGWDDRIDHNEGAITSLLISLAYAANELREFRLKNGDLKWKSR